MNSRQIVVDGQLIQYYQSGKGPVILCLHGWGDDGRTFIDLHNNFQANYQVVSFDLPGFGKSEPPHGDWGLDEFVALTNVFIDKLDLKINTIVGHSNGAAIAIRLLANQSERADKLVLLGAAGIRNVYKGKKKILRISAKAAKVLTAPLSAKTKLKLRKRAYRAIGSDMFVAEHMQETFKKVVEDDVQEDAKHIDKPTLLVYGAEDDQTPVAYGKLYNDIIQESELVIVPGAGHFVHHDQSTKVISVIQDFLNV